MSILIVGVFKVLSVFGELTPENTHHRDYAKWKAAYIHSCLKNGLTPVPGPAEGAPQREDDAGEDQAVGGGQLNNFDQPAEAGGWTQPVPAPRKPAQQTYSNLPTGQINLYVAALGLGSL